MQLRDISFSSPQENLTYDDVLLHLADKEEQGEYLRFWESAQIFIVLGRIGKQEDDIQIDQANKDGVPILRRSSGGGTVVQGPGCLNYTLILSKHNHPQLNDLRESYAWITVKVITALKEAGIDAYFKPISDLATGIHAKKFSGNAQKRTKHHILHHGTILYNFDLSLISRYLKMPKDIPEYRQGRSHSDFVTNISLSPQAFKTFLAKAFQCSELQAVSSRELCCLRDAINVKDAINGVSTKFSK